MSTILKNIQENEKYFSYEPIKKLDLSKNEKIKWLPFIKQIYEQNMLCNSLPNNKCANENFIHLSLTRDQNNEVVLTSYDCHKKIYMDNYLIRHFSDNKINLSMTNVDKNVKITDPNELKINSFLTNSIKKNSDIGLYFYGKSGIGKTHKIISYTNDMISKNNKKVCFIFLPQFVKQLKDNFDNNQNINKRLINNCCKCDILVFDDFGAEYTSTWFYSSVLLNILNYRIENNKPVIFISNFTFEQLEKILSKQLTNTCKINMSSVERIIDRIKELTRHTKCTFTTDKSRRIGINQL